MSFRKYFAVLATSTAIAIVPTLGCENADESRSLEVETDDGAMRIDEGEPSDVNVDPGPTAE